MKKTTLYLIAFLIPIWIATPVHALTTQEIAQRALASTVLVTMTNTSGRSSFGSGFVIDNGLIATNYHVIEGIVSGTVRLVGDANTHPIQSISVTDIFHDLAIIKAPTLSAPALTLGNSDLLVVGQSIFAAGNPQGFTGTFSEGIISAIRPEGNTLVEDTIIQITAPTSPGSSGGPVLNTDGEVIAVVFSGAVRGQNLNFAIPVNFLQFLVDSLTGGPRVTIFDDNLHAELRKALGKTLGSPITIEEMKTLTYFKANYDNIKDLTGLETATSLTVLELKNNKITDLTPLAALIQLEQLYLNDNDIINISALSGLTRLTRLGLSDNSISDISALSGLNRLTGLGLSENKIWDISALSNLTQLTELYLRDNLLLDLSPLVANSGLTTGDTIDIRVNHALTDASLNIHIPTLRNRGVIVDRTYVYLSGPSIVNVGQTVSLIFNVQDTINLSRFELQFRTYGTDSAFVSVEEGDFLKQKSAPTFFTAGTINTDDPNKTVLENIENIRLDRTGANGSGALVSLNLKGITIGYNRIYFTVELFTGTGEPILHSYQSSYYLEVVASWDANGDGEVNTSDLSIMAQNIGGYDETYDMNGDERVTVSDFVIVASHLGESITSDAPGILTKTIVPDKILLRWIDMAHAADDGSLHFQRGIENLEHLLSLAQPNATVLLPNYPNPFNPETWIPYRLAEAAHVKLTIYDTKGVPVRWFDLGHQDAGYYTHKAKAAYWDGRNNSGESVASGGYFYQLSADHFTATKKMIILK